MFVSVDVTYFFRSRQRIRYRFDKVDLRRCEHPCHRKQWCRCCRTLLWCVHENKCIRRPCCRHFPSEGGNNKTRLLIILVFVTIFPCTKWITSVTILGHLCDLICCPKPSYKLQVPIQSVKEHLFNQGIEVRIWFNQHRFISSKLEECRDSTIFTRHVLLVFLVVISLFWIKGWHYQLYESSDGKNLGKKFCYYMFNRSRTIEKSKRQIMMHVLPARTHLCFL